MIRAGRRRGEKERKKKKIEVAENLTDDGEDETGEEEEEEDDSTAAAADAWNDLKLMLILEEKRGGGVTGVSRTVAAIGWVSTHKISSRAEAGSCSSSRSSCPCTTYMHVKKFWFKYEVLANWEEEEERVREWGSERGSGVEKVRQLLLDKEKKGERI